MSAQVPDVRESDDCGSEDCSDLLRGVLGVEEGTWLMLVDHIYGSVVMKLQEGVLNALEEREEKVSWLVKQTKLDWQLRKHAEWDAALEDVEPDELEEEDTGRYVALRMTTPVSQRHLPPYFLGHFSPVLRRLFAVLLRFPASWRQDGENGRKMA